MTVDAMVDSVHRDELIWSTMLHCGVTNTRQTQVSAGEAVARRSVVTTCPVDRANVQLQFCTVSFAQLFSTADSIDEQARAPNKRWSV